MSIEATRWAWTQGIRPSVKLVLLAIADRAGTDGRAWPSVTRLSRDTGLDARSIYRHIRALSGMGLVFVESARGRTNVYRVNLAARVEARIEEGRGEAEREGGARIGAGPGEARIGEGQIEAGRVEVGAGCAGVTPDENATRPLTKSAGVPLTSRPPTPDSGVTPIIIEPERELPGESSGESSGESPGDSLGERPGGLAASSNGKGARAKKAQSVKITFGEFGNVRMTQEEHDKLLREHGVRGQKAIAKLDAFIGAKGDRYKSHYMAMFSWVLRAVDEDEARMPQGFRAGDGRDGFGRDGFGRDGLGRNGPPMPRTYAQAQDYDKRRQGAEALEIAKKMRGHEHGDGAVDLRADQVAERGVPAGDIGTFDAGHVPGVGA